MENRIFGVASHEDARMGLHGPTMKPKPKCPRHFHRRVWGYLTATDMHVLRSMSYVRQLMMGNTFGGFANDKREHFERSTVS